MVPVAVAGVAVVAKVVGVVVALEQAVLADNPVGAFRYIGAQHGGGQFAVVVRRQQIANVVQQGGNYHFLVGIIPVGAGGRLQRMLQAVHLIAGQGAGQAGQLRQHPVGGGGGEFRLQTRQQFVVGAGAGSHAGKGYGGGARRAGGIGCRHRKPPAALRRLGGIALNRRYGVI